MRSIGHKKKEKLSQSVRQSRIETYGLKREEVLKTFLTSEGGLTSEEAKKRLTENGRNALKEGKKKSKLLIFFEQFKDLMTIILVLAAFLSGILAFVTGDKSELADTGILLFIILLNAFVGFLQQYRADAALEKLKQMSVTEAKVVRDGKVVVVNAEEIVAGDIVEIEEGDRIPADCRVLESNDFRTDESALTGESKPVKKCDCIVTKPALAERRNTAHFSTFCVKGSARCVVTATGMDTEMGKIANLLEKSKPAPTPLDKTIARLGKIISIFVLSVALVLFIGGLLSHRVSFLQNVMNAVAVAVAAIPEGMGAVVTIILAMGVQRMAKARSVMRKLSAVETLGGCTVICSDKTGTLTENRMTVQEIATSFSSGAEEKFTGTEAQNRLLQCIRVCHSLKKSAEGYVGDHTEIALLEYADKCGYSYEAKAVGGIAFSSERKMMSVAAAHTGEARLYVKGGADVLLKKCDKIYTERGAVPLDERTRRAIYDKIKEMSGKAMRVLAFAEGAFLHEVREENLTFLGLAAMLDPPKEGAKEAVLACKRAGVRTVMITGDSADSAFAIAKRLSIASKPEEVITGDELDAMSEEEFFRRVKGYSVYARVSPKHKTEIVRALQSHGEIVAMTGDGVNDAPSIKTADIGVAMGSGTDVTKNAADMVITDDDFKTMTHAIEEGRNVFYNIKKTISFFLATNLAEVLAVLIVSLFLWKYEFLTSTQLLFVNLITDSLPVLALGVERTENAMLRPPVSEREIFSKKSLLEMLFYGLVQTAIVVGLFVFALGAWGNGAASTAAFVALSLLELFHAFNVRRDGSRNQFKKFFSNKTLLLTVLAGIVINVLLVVCPPLRLMFGLTALDLVQWVAVFGLSLAIIPVGALADIFFRRLDKGTKKARPQKISRRAKKIKFSQ
ncbi:MAG: cation-translocating P-type ATPase [Clostridia bacterium]|nr:cation-translocating P-type ATPase [Clostridia bacterium]